MFKLLLFTCLITYKVIDAVPQYKYPYNFLLDIGNSQLKGSEVLQQIQLTVKGGTTSIRYPGAGYGDLITHIKVVASDYSTDLTAQVTEGGPGYRYMNLWIASNENSPFQVVISIEGRTAKDPLDTKSVNDYTPANSVYDAVSKSIDAKVSQYNDQLGNRKGETNYDYEEKHSSDGLIGDEMYPDGDGEYKGTISYNDDDDTDNSDEDADSSDDVKQSSKNTDDSPQSPIAAKYQVEENDNGVSYSENFKEEIADPDLYARYQALRPHLFENMQLGPHGGQDANLKPHWNDDGKGDPRNDDQVYNSLKYGDSGNVASGDPKGDEDQNVDVNDGVFY